MRDLSGILLVTDLDGTFLGANGAMVSRNVEALRRFRAAGGCFTIATGRLHLNIRAAIPEPEALLTVPAVMCNGAYLYDFTSGERMEDQFLAPTLAGELLCFLRERLPELLFRVSTPTELRLEELTGLLKRDAPLYDPGVLHISRPAEKWRLDDWYKLVLRGEPEELERAAPILRERFAGRISVTLSGARLLELQPPDCTKAAGLVRLRKRLCSGRDAHRDIRCVIACGDFDNDIEMLRAADIAIAPQNAREQVKAIADAVLCDHREGLIADVVEALEAGQLA